MSSASPLPASPSESFGNRVRRAVLWRSGSQIVAQGVQWASTFLVIRLLSPHDYGLFAMSQAVIVLLNMLDGMGLASGLIQRPHVTRQEIRQLFGLLLLLNAGLALGQVLLAPYAADYFHQPVVATMLRVQALLHLSTPFIALPMALLSREMDFRHQARANIAASLAGAGTALGGALLGWGVWALVLAPIALFTTRAVMMTLSARSLVWPSFDFRGIGGIARFGGIVAAGQLFWFAQSQADVFIAGHHVDARALGLYTTALFLTQIFVAKLLPPLNEVAFSAFARLQDDGAAFAAAFVRGARIVMAAALPFYLGLSVTAAPLVLTVLGPKWAATAPLVQMLALAMPFMTLQSLLAPACDGRGRPGIGVTNGAFGAALLIIAFSIGIRWGLVGIAAAWIVAYPLYLAISLARVLPVIGVRFADLSRAILPSALAALGMALAVRLLDPVLPAMPVPARLAVLVATGALVYAGLLGGFARATVRDMLALVRRR